MARIEVPPELLERLKGTVGSGSRELETLGDSDPPGINAGESTPPVAETLGQLLQATAGVLKGVQQMATDIQATRETYLSNDDAAADLFTSPDP